MSFLSKKLVGSGTSEASSVNNSRELSTDSRKRQSKRDDAIRRKIESELSKKRKNGTKITRQRRGAPGTVLALKPSAAVTCKPTSSVFEASQLMTAKRENCILVVNDSKLLGIFTAKDLAFRVVGSSLNANTVTIDKIMTPDPLCANANDSASDALNVMVDKGFRHLPVLDDSEHIVGVLDITKCYAQQMERLERMHESSKKLHEALDNVHTEIGVGQHPFQIYQYFEQLKNRMNGPTLDSVLNATTVPIYCTIKATVYQVTVLMKENKTTAVLVKDNEGKVNGIFTSKDVVLRVIAAGLDPTKCSIVRVMTPQPDMASHSLSIQASLRKMFDGHYLNLPVVDDSNEIVGIVEVLRLTYATLNQIKLINENETNSDLDSESRRKSEGPAWNKFWTELGKDSDSAHSESFHLESSGMSESAKLKGESLSGMDFLNEIKPSDSISHVDTPKKVSLNTLNEPFVFKFRSPAIENRVHRISLKPYEGLQRLRDLIDEKLHEKDFEFLQVSIDGEGTPYAISYIDDEGDVVSITSDDDLLDCVQINLRMSNDKADLYIHNVQESAPVKNTRFRKLKSKKDTAGDLIPGVPNEILISGALMILATTALVGFSLSRK